MPEVRIVMLTMSEDENDLFDAVRGGASGYLLKNVDANSFFDYLEDLQEGHPPFSPGLAEKILNAFSSQSTKPEAKVENDHSANTPTQTKCADRLSTRQTQVLTLVAQGQNYREVASILNISERTVKYHMGEILCILMMKTK